MSTQPTQRIPVLDLQKQYEQIAETLESSVLEVLRSGNYILGKKLARLEQEIASLCGSSFGIGVANGTDALILALWALDIGPGDEVITSPFTFAATAEAIVLRGARPVFVDVDAATFNIDASLIERAVTPATRAILPVHLYGQPADMDAINSIAGKRGLKVIEDNAQAIGATYHGQTTGSLSDVACISFYPTKNLGACGDAGMLVTSDPALADRLKVLRAHGSRKRYYHDELGVNSRLDEIQAVALLAKLPYLNLWNQLRAKIANAYGERLAGCPGLMVPRVAPGTTHVFHQYTVRILGNSLERRDGVKQELAARNIDSMCYYPLPLHLQPAFAHLGYRPGDFPVAETLANEVLSLPMYPELGDKDIDRVAAALFEIMSSGSPAVPSPAVQPAAHS
jgi:dTDP-4-amino-4,6-dideoxygalactose transaminase